MLLKPSVRFALRVVTYVQPPETSTISMFLPDITSSVQSRLDAAPVSIDHSCWAFYRLRGLPLPHWLVPWNVFLIYDVNLGTFTKHWLVMVIQVISTIAQQDSSCFTQGTCNLRHLSSANDSKTYPSSLLNCVQKRRKPSRIGGEDYYWWWRRLD